MSTTFTGITIARARKRLSMSQEDLAAIVGCRARTISRIETGESRGDRELMEKIAEALEKGKRKKRSRAGK